MYKNGLIRKMRLISKFMTSKPGLKIIAIHVLTNILRSKGNQEMEFGKLREYNSRNIFLEKSYTKIFPDPFLKIKTDHIYGSIG